MAVVVVVVSFLLPDSPPPSPDVTAAVPSAAPPPEQAEHAEQDEQDEQDEPAAPPSPPEGDPTSEDTDGLEAEAVEGDVPAPPTPLDLPSGQIVEVPESERRFIQHVVVPVETLEQIAHRYGVRPDGLRAQNGLRADANELANGTTLRVKARRLAPPRVRYQYVVQPGDTWWKIGTRFGVDSIDLRSFNFDGGGRLRVGQTLEMWLDPVLFEWIAVEESPDDPTVIRPGAASIGTPQNGRLINGVEVPDADYYHKKYPTSSYGTTHAVRTLMEGLARFEARCRYDRKLWLAQMSRKHGGPLDGHRSHQTGRDLDIRLPLRVDVPDDSSVRPDRVDWVAVWHLISAFLETGEVSVIFLDYQMQGHVYEAAKKLGSTKEELRSYLQYPTGPQAGGLVRDSPGHEAHIHVRFKCGPHEPECVQLQSDDERE